MGNPAPLTLCPPVGAGPGEQREWTAGSPGECRDRQLGRLEPHSPGLKPSLAEGLLTEIPDLGLLGKDMGVDEDEMKEGGVWLSASPTSQGQVDHHFPVAVS